MAIFKFSVCFVDHDGKEKVKYLEIKEESGSRTRAEQLAKARVGSIGTHREVHSIDKVQSQIKIVSVEDLTDEK